ncbi:MAG: hypothetical protein JEZ06_15105 [Anaerolineaceae bacterium]|nr:hypothetical protein [Anaerolineaceae bacterium]
MRKWVYAIILVVLCLSVPLQNVSADDGDPPGLTMPEDDSGERPVGWEEFIDTDGSLMDESDGVYDLGIISVKDPQLEDVAGWVQTLFNLQPEASYHAYSTEDGQVLLFPTTETLIMKTLAGDEIGEGSVDTFGRGLGRFFEGIRGVISGEGWDEVSDYRDGENYESDWENEIIDQLLAGDLDAYSNFFSDDMKKLIIMLNERDDINNYQLMMLYNNCNLSPIGCPQELVDKMRNTPKQTAVAPTPIPAIGNCTYRNVTQGRISATLHQLAPNYVVVVGQDLEKRGVDLLFELQVGPTIYEHDEWEIVEEWDECSNGAYDVWNCPEGLLNHEEIWDCVLHTEYICEPVDAMTLYASLSQDSRDWILGELVTYYPGASLYKPDWVWPGNIDQYGGCSGGGYIFQQPIRYIQVRDPGTYETRIAGSTMGTRLTPPRGFNLEAGTFYAKMFETTIIH